MKTLLSTFFGLFMILSMSSQVGVNNPTPEQALDVNGKVKLTDDTTAPTAGTIRYDATSSDFEGYIMEANGTRLRKVGLPACLLMLYLSLDIQIVIPLIVL